MTFDEVIKKLLESDGEGNYFEPIIGPTEDHIVFDWSDWSIMLLPDMTWRVFGND